MPRATPLPVRQALWNAAQTGLDVASLAARFGLAPRTARHLLSSFRRAGGQVHPPAYRPGGQTPNPAHVDCVVSLRQIHPRWGAGMLRVQLARRFPDDPLPHPRTIQRWLRRARLSAAPAGRKRPPRQRASAVHEVWEVDASDQLRLGNGQLVSWLRLTDEHSGPVLQTVVSPLGLEQRADGAGAAEPA